MLLLRAGHDACLLVVTDTLLEEVGLASKGDILHEVEGVGRLVVLLVSEGEQEAISNEFDILLHEVRVHAQESAGKGLGQELLLNGDRFSDHIQNGLLAWSVLQVGKEQASKVGVKTLVTRNQLVGEGEASHQSTLLQPEDGREGTTEEDTLNSGKCHKALSEGGRLVLDPLDSPVGLLLNARNCEMALVYCKYNLETILTCLNSVEEVGSLGLLLDVGVDEERVSLRVDVLHHDLEAVEASSFRNLDLSTETLDQVLVDNSVRGSEEGEDVGDEITLVIVESVVPVVEVLGQINFLSSPEGCFGFLVHLPDLFHVVSGQKHFTRSASTTRHSPHGT